MSEPRRMAAIRRLFLAKLAKMPSDMPQEMKVEAARRELDKTLGPIWRDEVDDAGFGMDPTGDMKERLDKLPCATREAGFSGEDVPPPTKKKSEEPKGKSMLHRLMMFFNGK